MLATVDDVQEGHIPVPGGRVWYRRVGTGDRGPLLVIHGGPGAGHDYLEPLERLAQAGRAGVVWDPPGRGPPEAPVDPGLYHPHRLAEEIPAGPGALDADTP